MKTKTLLLVCLLLGTGLAQIYAQNGQNGTGTVVQKDFNQLGWVQVFCPDEKGVYVMVDELYAMLNTQVILHIKNNADQWFMLVWEGVMISEKNQEVFQVHESDKIAIPNPDNYTYHYNLVGNMGSHYINSGTFDFSNNWVFTLNKAVCPEK